MKQNCRLVALGTDQQIDSLLNAMVQNACSHSGEAANQELIRTVQTRNVVLGLGGKEEIPFAPYLLAPNWNETHGTMFLWQVATGLFAIQAEYSVDSFRPEPLLALHNAAGQIPMFVLHAGESFADPKGETDFRDGAMDSEFGDGGAAFLFFFCRREQWLSETQCKQVLREINAQAGRRDDTAGETIDDLFSFYEYLSDAETPVASQLNELRQTDPDEYYECILDFADGILWDADHSDQVIAKLVTLQKYADELLEESDHE